MQNKRKTGIPIFKNKYEFSKRSDPNRNTWAQDHEF